MVSDDMIKRGLAIVLLVFLAIAAFIVIRPIFISLLWGLLLAYIFYPVYQKVLSYVKEKNMSALIVCLLIFLVIFIPLWFLIPVIFKQTFEAYSFLQQANIFDTLQKIFPSFSGSGQFSKEIIVAVNSFITNSASTILNSLVDVLSNIILVILQFVITLFVFFFGLRDGKELANFASKISPLPSKMQAAFLKKFKAITKSVIYGQIVVGIFQGIFTAIGLFIFKSPSPLLLSLLAVFVGIIPVIGPWLVWFPAAVYLILSGNIFGGIGLMIYGFLIVSWVDTLIRPLIVSKKARVSSPIVLIGMVGGLFVFGVLGLIIGPLILSYLILVLEMYKDKKLRIYFK